MREFAWEIEGKFGKGKRKLGLGRVMTKLAQTSETSIALTFLVMNLEKLLRQFYCRFLCSIFGIHTFWRQKIRRCYLNVLCYQKRFILRASEFPESSLPPADLSFSASPTYCTTRARCPHYQQELRLITPGFGII